MCTCVLLLQLLITQQYCVNEFRHTGNFIIHLRRKHSELFEKYKVVKTDKSDIQTAQQKFEKKLLFAIVDCSLPVSLFERRSFRESYEMTGLKVPSRQTAMMILEGQYNNMLEKIRADISSAKYFCTTADIWSGNHRSFFGYTCHWFDDKLERRSAALACRRLTGTHSSEKLTQVISDINSSYGLNSSNVVMTVTDNGSNFVKAFKEHGVSPDMDDIGNDLPQFENECILPKHQRCASHTLNLLATTDFLKILKSNTELDYQNNMVFQKCSALWKKCSYPKSSEVVVRVLGCSLVFPVVTRWNSLYDAVKRLLQHKEKLGHLCCEVNVPQIHSGDLRCLESYVALMEPVAAALDFMQGHKEVKYGFLIPTLMTLSNKLIKFSENNEFVIFRSLVINLEKKLRKRFEPYFLLAPEANIAVAAAVLTPGIKNKWIKVLQRTNPAMTVERVNRIVIQSITESLNEDNVTPSARLESTADAAAAISNQYYSYLNDDSTAEDSLNKYCYLREAYIKFNTPLPSSAPVERLFSFAGIINSPRRQSMTDFSFEKLVIMKANYKYCS